MIIRQILYLRNCLIISLSRRTTFQVVEKGFKVGQFWGMNMIMKIFWVDGSFLCK